MKKALKLYYTACEEVRTAFCKKYFKNDYDDKGWWVGEEVGGGLAVSDQYVDMHDMVKALELKMTVDEWHDYYWWRLDYELKDPPLNMKNYVQAYRKDKTKIPKYDKL